MIWGGIYAAENRNLESIGVIATVPNGNQYNATASTGIVKIGIGYQQYSSWRWSTIVTYLYQDMHQRLTAGTSRSTGCGRYGCSRTDNSDYADLAQARISETHVLFAGRELHFYPGRDGWSLDLIGQLGYQVGTYYPFAGYNDVISRYGSPAGKTLISDVPGTFIHGPALRAGAGATLLRWTNIPIRVIFYYQLSYLFGATQVWTNTNPSPFFQEINGTLTLGYAFD